MTTATKPTARTKPAEKVTPATPGSQATPVEGVASDEQTTRPTPATLVEALITGQATLLKVRGNGTKRALPYLAVGARPRAEAERVAEMKAAGQTVKAIADTLNVSSATARRILNSLALAHAVEAGDHDAAWTPGTKDVIVHAVTMRTST